ncbi:MAG: hypothetical protein HY236_11380 [Acidobacteria bacterium]|nr:hypothetical protein [Acidobacteriota bacterium]
MLWNPQRGQFGDLLGKATNRATALAKKPEAAPEPPKEIAKNKKSANKSTGEKGARNSREAADPEEKKIVTAEVMPPIVLAPALPFPSASEIAIGMDRAKLLAQFGKPAMKTTAVDGDRLLETFVYVHRDPNTATFVLLQNARVVSAHTTIY